jgi:tight adherence protein C
MPLTLILSVVAVFISVAAIVGLATSRVLEWSSPERQRLRELGSSSNMGVGVVREDTRLVETPDPLLRRLSKMLPSSPKEMSGVRRQLAAAGYYDLSAAIYYSTAKFVLPVVLGGALLLLMGIADGWMFAAFAAVVGYLIPDLILANKVRAHAKAIQNGLPDVLDLVIVCIEAGSALDQAIVKATEELGLAHPALAVELRMLTTEIRAGKSRMEAFRNFASRTRVDDVRSLVTMLTQTDRFGTSVAQALRTHAEVSRTKRRQRAEERAAKIGAKLVFPLALCIFPVVYAVCLGPVAIKIYRGLLLR